MVAGEGSLLNQFGTGTSQKGLVVNEKRREGNYATLRCLRPQALRRRGGWEKLEEGHRLLYNDFASAESEGDDEMGNNKFQDGQNDALS